MPRKRQPLYMQIYRDLLAAIHSGEFAPGSRIPTEQELSERYGVSRITPKRALTQLVQEGWIERIPGRGSFVRQDRSHGSDGLVAEAEPRRIGFVAQDLGISYGTGLLSGVEEETRRANVSLLVRFSAGRQSNEQAAIREMTANGCAGIILFPVNGATYGPAVLQTYLAGLPMVLLDRYFPGLDIASVSSDNKEAAERATSHLMDLGHSQVLLLSPPEQNAVTVEDRIEGYFAAFTARGKTVDHSLIMTDLTTRLPGTVQDDSYAADLERITRMLSARPDISAVLALEYSLALIAHEAAQRLGRTIPEELSIICFDHPPLAEGQRPYFTHMAQDERNMGKVAVRCLLELIANSSVEEPRRLHSLLPVRLVHGDSTAPPTTRRSAQAASNN